MHDWTADEADAALPRVTEVLEQIRAVALAMTTGVGGNGHGEQPRGAPGGTERLGALLADLEREGIVVRDAQRGLVDFPARAPSGRAYWLCWVLGEPEVAWWHWPEDGFAGRRRLDVDPPT